MVYVDTKEFLYHCRVILFSLAFTCEDCKRHSYCSKLCQNEDWREGHNKVCETTLVNRLTKIERGCPFITEGTIITHKRNTRRVITNYERINVEGKATSLLDKGEHSQVVLMRDKKNKRKVGVKIINKVIKAGILNVLKEKIKIAQTFVHRNVVQVLDFDEDTKFIYVVMEYASKGNLQHYIRTRRRLQEKEAFYYFSQVCNGVNFLNKNNIKHGVVESENILINDAGQIKLYNIGYSDEIVKFINATKADVQSLGILLYEMLHGYKPEYNVVFLNTVPEHVKELINVLMNKDPPYLLELFEMSWVKRMQAEFQIKDRVASLGDSEFIGDDILLEESLISRLNTEEIRTSNEFIDEDKLDVEEEKTLGEIKNIKGTTMSKYKGGYATSDTIKNNPESTSSNIESFSDHDLEQEKSTGINEVLKSKVRSANPKSVRETALIKSETVKEVRIPEFEKILSDKEPEKIKELEDTMRLEKYKALSNMKRPPILYTELIKEEVNKRLLTNIRTREKSFDSGDYEFQRCESLMKVHKYLDDLEGGALPEELDKHVKDIEDENKKLARVCEYYGVIDLELKNVQEEVEEFADTLNNNELQPKDAYKTMSIIIKSMMNLEEQESIMKTIESSSEPLPIVLKDY